MKKNAKFRVINRNIPGNKYGVISDKIIKIIGIKSDLYNEPLRMVEYYDKETKKRFRFVTNNFKMKSIEIPDIYKR